MWKILWHDARRAATDGDSAQAAELFDRSLAEAQRIAAQDDPNFADFLNERNQFFRVYNAQTEKRTFADAGKPQDWGHIGDWEREPIPDPVRKLCGRCGRTAADCHCLPFAKPDVFGASEFKPGDLIAGSYQVVRVIGHGGMTFVYLVRDQADKLFALKILHKEYTDNREASGRFEREAQIIRKMRHPNIVSVFDFGKMPDGRSYFVMEFVDGPSLHSALEKESRLSMTRTCTIFSQICDAMAHAHSLGIVHRDLKPSNIVLLSENDKADHVKVVDFGIAKITDPWGDRDARLTQDGQVVGSPAYMSPEQCLDHHIDHRSDIYSVGCVMYQSLCGVPPFCAENPLAILVKHVKEAPTSIAVSSGTILPRLEQIVLRALAKDPNDRYGSMAEMKSELVQFMIQDL